MIGRQRPSTCPLAHLPTCSPAHMLACPPRLRGWPFCGAMRGDEETYTVCLRVRGPPRGTPEYRRRTLPSMAARARLTYASRRRLSPLAHSSAHARLVCSMD